MHHPNLRDAARGFTVALRAAVLLTIVFHQLEDVPALLAQKIEQIFFGELVVLLPEELEDLVQWHPPDTRTRACGDRDGADTKDSGIAGSLDASSPLSMCSGQCTLIQILKGPVEPHHGAVEL